MTKEQVEFLKVVAAKATAVAKMHLSITNSLSSYMKAKEWKKYDENMQWLLKQFRKEEGEQ